VIVWETPGPYRVGFTTRGGGVSGGAYASLNLGATGDDPAAIGENRRRVCAMLDLDETRLAVNTQRHGSRVNRARSGGVGEEGDALVTNERGLPLLALSADCVPIAIVTTAGEPALAVVHAGWRGLAAGVVEAAAAALGSGVRAAMLGPSIGPCCYVVGPEVSGRFPARFSRARMFDLRAAAAAALRRGGVGLIERVEVCTCCNSESYFSHRASGGGEHGLQGVIGALEL